MLYHSTLQPLKIVIHNSSNIKHNMLVKMPKFITYLLPIIELLFTINDQTIINNSFNRTFALKLNYNSFIFYISKVE